MKKSLVFMIAVLLVGALMISCSGDVSNNSDNLATVSLKTDTSKGLSTTPSSNITEVDALYWYFTAIKTDGSMFTTGATSIKIPVVSEGQTGLNDKFIGGVENKRMFSTGSWSFSFYGYKTASTTGELVYKCENLAVTITGNTELTLTLDTASDSPAQLILGSPNPYWTYEFAGSGTSLTLKIYEGSTLLATSTGAVDDDHKASFSQLKVNDVNADYVELTAGIHNLNFEVWYGGEKVGESALNLNAKANTSYSVTGDIAVLDSTFWVHIDSVTKSTAVIESTSPTVMSVPISPLSATTVASETSTTVNFENATESVSDTNATYTLAVDVLAGTGVSVSATSENVNVANIDLTLTKTTGTTVENVTSFAGSGDGYVLVTTYIGKDLTNVKVNGVAVGGAASGGVSDVHYNPVSGELSFHTNHFSEFGVTSDAVATITNESTVYYSTLASAFDAAQTGDTIKLYADSATSVSYTVPAGKALTVDFNGKTVTSSKVTTTVGDAGFLVNNGTLTFTDLSNNETVGGVVSSNNNVIINNGTMTINKGSFKGNRTGVLVLNDVAQYGNTRGVVFNSQNGNLTITDIYLYTAQDYGVLNRGVMTISGGNYVSDSRASLGAYGYCVTSQAGSMTMTAGTVRGMHGCISVNGGNATIGGTVYAKTYNTTNDGTVTDNNVYRALYLAGEVGTCSTVITGGTFESFGMEACLIGNKNDGGVGAASSLTIEGGHFIGSGNSQAIRISTLNGYGEGSAFVKAGVFENAKKTDGAAKVYGSMTLDNFLVSDSSLANNGGVYTVAVVE